jgi:hypothetical protein
LVFSGWVHSTQPENTKMIWIGLGEIDNA